MITPLHEAVMHGQEAIVKFLVAKGADIHSNDDYALLTAARYGYMSIVKFLVSVGAKRYDAIDVARKNNHMEVVDLLSDLRAKEASDKLVYWSLGGNVKIAESLLLEGADIHYRNDEALRRAIKYGHDDLVKFLISRGASIDKI